MGESVASTPDYRAYPPPPLPADAKPRADLTADQAEMQTKVQAHFGKEDYKLPGEKDESAALTEEEEFWLTYECMLRYLRATKWNLKNAIQRLEETLKWRRTFGIYTTNAADVEPEALTGKQFTFGFDTKRRPALYLIPSRQNTQESPRQIQFAVWILERSLELTAQGVESIVLMINFADRSKNPSMSTSRTVLDILQSHYPERLGAALILNVPFLISAFFKIISPFIDPITREKMKFNPNAVADGLFEADSLSKDGGWGGAREIVWDHDKYWPSLVQMCAEIREKRLEKWRQLGARVGLKEWDIKEGETMSEVVAETTTAAPAADDADPFAARKMSDIVEMSSVADEGAVEVETAA